MYLVMVLWHAKAIGRVFPPSWLLQSGQLGGFELLLFHVGNGPCWVPGAGETSPPSMELPPFPVLECCRIGLPRLVAIAGFTLVFQLAAKAPLTSSPQLLLIDLSPGMCWDVNQSIEESSCVLRLESLILFYSGFFSSTFFLSLILLV